MSSRKSQASGKKGEPLDGRYSHTGSRAGDRPRKVVKRLGQAGSLPKDEERDVRSTFTDTSVVIVETKRRKTDDDTQVDIKPPFPVETDAGGSSVVDVELMGRHTKAGSTDLLVIESENEEKGEVTLVGAQADPQHHMARRYFPDFSEGNGSLRGIRRMLERCYFENEGELKSSDGSITTKKKFIARLEMCSDFPILVHVIRRVAEKELERLDRNLKRCDMSKVDGIRFYIFP